MIRLSYCLRDDLQTHYDVILWLEADVETTNIAITVPPYLLWFGTDHLF